MSTRDLNKANKWLAVCSHSSRRRLEMPSDFSAISFTVNVNAKQFVDNEWVNKYNQLV